jgi:hypothetical protein
MGMFAWRRLREREALEAAQAASGALPIADAMEEPPTQRRVRKVRGKLGQRAVEVEHGHQ